MTRKALAEGLRILGMNHHVPALKCHVPVMKLRLKMNHLAALQGQVSPPHQNSTSASSSTSEQVDNYFWPNLEKHHRNKCYPEKNLDMFFLTRHLRAQNVFLNFILLGRKKKK